MDTVPIPTDLPGALSLRTIKINLKPDTLHEEIVKFEQKPLKQPLFLNSVPKCGSHLLRNIVRMFVPVDRQYTLQFVQHQILMEHLGAFSDERNFLSWGHLMFSDITAVATGRARQILLIRDPYDWVLARARFFISDEFQGMELLKDGTIGVEAIMNMMILGIQEKAPPLTALFTHNAVGWFGTGVHLLRYEELIDALKHIDDEKGEAFFKNLLEVCGIDCPHDWRERVKIGSDRKFSGTARENLTGAAVELPKELPDLQKRMVDFAAPGLRAMLGYA